MTKIFVQISILLLVATQVLAQSDQELAVSQALAAKTINEVEQIGGRQRFYVEHTDQLNSDVTQTNWRPTKGKKIGRIALLTLSINGKIFYSEIYSWDINDEFDGFDHQVLQSKLDSTFSFPSFNPDHLERVPNRTTFGYGCGAAGQMPEEGKKMLTLAQAANTNELKNWLFSINPVRQAYSYLGFSLLQANGTELDTDIKTKMSQVKESGLLVYFCDGCTVREPMSLSEVLDDASIKRFTARQQE